MASLIAFTIELSKTQAQGLKIDMLLYFNFLLENQKVKHLDNLLNFFFKFFQIKLKF